MPLALIAVIRLTLLEGMETVAWDYCTDVAQRDAKWKQKAARIGLPQSVVNAMCAHPSSTRVLVDALAVLMGFCCTAEDVTFTEVCVHNCLVCLCCLARGGKLVVIPFAP